MENKRKRYLVITEKFPPRKGGSNTTFEEVYKRIGDKGTHIVTTDQPGAADFDKKSPNTVHRLPLERVPWLRPESLLIYARLLRKSLSLAWTHIFDEVHCGRVLSEGFVGWIVSRMRRLPLLIYAHGEEITTWRTPAKYRLMRFVFRKADALLANSRFTARLLQDLGVDKHKIHVVYPGVDLDFFRPCADKAKVRQGMGIDNGQAIILSVGRLTRRKGFHQVIQALPILKDLGVNATHVVAGIGPDEAFLRETAVRCGVADRVRLLGPVPDEELLFWYQAADVFAMPNYDVGNDTEGFGKVYVEASACKTPPIAGLTGGTGDAVIHEVTGFRVDGSSVSAVAEALHRLLTDTELNRQLAEQGYERAHREFSWDVSAQRTADILGKGKKT
ncbi:phosphatidylinositol alpha-1,6-mannosyltransferase [Desulfacinum infernum DSM 9756]|uniref:Phosphatidylinositol alpha-1,6-mannosyltransferase n=1 Tax=Desulfacinum infernum DSM 9756 TaxID=1121391 RepID=A0A1M4WW97_9BACT|nr:glycosyltransferase family 4 protein [Desulfacinum infernum]SHE85509.1 phosphatidylinositol alpha-1,6-mannosyltransferase [Desulfacinum infernum DSM 9756]